VTVADSSEIPSQVLLIEYALGDMDALAERIRALGMEPIQLAGSGQAEEVLAEPATRTSAILISTELPLKNLKRELRRLRKVAPTSGLVFVSAGKTPPKEERKRLRAAGVTLALWEPYEESTLRYQLNRAVNGDRDEHKRAKPRAPTDLPALISVAERARQANIYSLSPGGAFLQTTRASMDGAKIEIELHLPEGPISARGEVTFANVPGNLQRPNLPLGIGVRFENLDPESQKKIASYIEQRLTELKV
jgi:Tfp pilus assembly protein PilZ